MSKALSISGPNSLYIFKKKRQDFLDRVWLYVYITIKMFSFDNLTKQKLGGNKVTLVIAHIVRSLSTYANIDWHFVSFHKKL